MKKKILSLLAIACCGLLWTAGPGEAKAATPERPGQGKKIVYIPIDTRPVNDSQTVAVAEKLGYEVLVPPKEMLGGREDYGHPEELLKWLEQNAPGARAAVVSTDAMLYGSLVGSRMHDLTAEKILHRAEQLKSFQEKHPGLPLYAFGTIMRTPRGGAYSSAEPAYYQEYGAGIFRYTALLDKEEMEGLSRKEQKEKDKLKQEIPEGYLQDWLQRRAKNYNANTRLMEMAEEGVFNYFLLGCDDSAVPSQTHLESRHLEEQGSVIGKTRSVVTSGADELGMLMMARAINDNLRNVPFIYAEYARGKGRDTIPDYTNEKIGESVDKAIASIGALQVMDPQRADLVLLVSTSPDGKTFEANSPKNTRKPRRGTREFLAKVKDYTGRGYPVAVADIACGNGADNALLEGLRQENLQFCLRGYGGWNTATNSTGFLLGSASFVGLMSRADAEELLLTRYLDDWAYQANVRGEMANLLPALPGEGNYSKLDGKKEAAEAKTAELMALFLKENLCSPLSHQLKGVKVTFPWNRMFECDVQMDLEKK